MKTNTVIDHIYKDLNSSALQLGKVMQLDKHLLTVKNIRDGSNPIWTNVYNCNRRFKRADKLILNSKNVNEKVLAEACKIVNGEWEPKFFPKDFLKVLNQWRIANVEFQILWNFHLAVLKNGEYVKAHLAKYKNHI